MLKPAVVALNVSQEKRLAILERQEDFPGVGVTQLWVRTYPGAAQLHDPTLAAQVLGFVGEIDEGQLQQLKHRGYLPGDEVGKDGVESAYESVLRGDPTIETVEVDPTGRQVGEPISVVPGSVGHDVYLTIDTRIQKASEDTLAAGITAARTQQDTSIRDHLAFDKAPAGAVVVLDAQDGSVVAMASNPAFPPSAWAGGVSQQAFNELSSPEAHNPLLNRTTEGLYAPGSAFKLVTSVASTHDGVYAARTSRISTRAATRSATIRRSRTTVVSHTAPSICSAPWQCRVTRTSIPSVTSCGTDGAPVIRTGSGSSRSHA